MEKIIIVHYVGTRDLTSEETVSTINHYHKMISKVEDDKDYKHYIVADPNSNSIKLDCINPKLVNQSEYDRIMERLEYLSKQLEKD